MAKLSSLVVRFMRRETVKTVPSYASSHTRLKPGVIERSLTGNVVSVTSCDFTSCDAHGLCFQSIGCGRSRALRLSAAFFEAPGWTLAFVTAGEASLLA